MPTGHKHSPAGNTNGAAERPRTVIPPKAETVSGKMIEIRSLDVWIAVGTYRVRTLIVGKQKDNVRTLGRSH